jgi:ribosome biogenesis GTPase / thiamine phosphate phosphatase
MSALITGTVTIDLGREFVVETEELTPIACVRKGKKHDVTCGDTVEVRLVGDRQGSIEKVLPRRNLLYRSDQWKERSLAANIDQAIIIVAPKPNYSETFLNLTLLACEAAQVPILIVVNKQDLPEHAQAMVALAPYRSIGYTLLPLSAKADIAPLIPYLTGKTSLLVGQSGMGKSRMVNAILMDQRAREGEISLALGTGKHTTTFTRLYRAPNWGRGTAIIDSPGFQTFGLFHLSEAQMAESMREFRPFLGSCKFHDCAHLDEPGCVVRAACEQGSISQARLAFYQALLLEQRDLHEQHPEWKRT